MQLKSLNHDASNLEIIKVNIKIPLRNNGINIYYHSFDDIRAIQWLEPPIAEHLATDYIPAQPGGGGQLSVCDN